MATSRAVLPVYTAIAPHFLSIPPELRCMIYTYALKDAQLTFELHWKTRFAFNSFWKEAPFWIHEPAIYQALSQTCLQIRSEIQPYLEKITSWHFMGDKAVDHFLVHASENLKNNITELTGISTAVPDISSRLLKLPKLRSLHIRSRPICRLPRGSVEKREVVENLAFKDILELPRQDYYWWLDLKRTAFRQIGSGEWNKVVVEVEICADWRFKTYGSSDELINEGLTRHSVPYKIDLINEVMTRQVTNLSQTFGWKTIKTHDKWAACQSSETSAIAEAQYALYEYDNSALLERYGKYLGANYGTVTVSQSKTNTHLGIVERSDRGLLAVA